MRWKTILLLTTLHVLAESRLVYRSDPSSNNASDIPLEYLKTPDFIELCGLIAESHDVTTEDGYILRLHRIPADELLNTNKVAIIQHGLGGATDNWMIYKNRSLPAMLRRAGYDVWLINSRGNSYSRKHINMTDKDKIYWNFSYHEMGYYDLPASIDYALNTTGAEKLWYIGHSRGTTSSYILLSLRPEYNDKLKLLISMAPVAYVKHARNILAQFCFHTLSPSFLSKVSNAAGFVAFPGLVEDSARHQRRYNKLVRFITQLFLTSAYGQEYTDEEADTLIITHFPDGAAVKDLLHFLQLGQTDVFAPYSYSESKNMAVYNATQPPAYPLHNITVPAVFYHADNDMIVSRPDWEKLIKQLPNVMGVYRVPDKNFKHMDFEYGSSADKVLYEGVIDLMGNYTDTTK